AGAPLAERRGHLLEVGLGVGEDALGGAVLLHAVARDDLDERDERVAPHEESRQVRDDTVRERRAVERDEDLLEHGNTPCGEGRAKSLPPGVREFRHCTICGGPRPPAFPPRRQRPPSPWGALGW